MQIEITMFAGAREAAGKESLAIEVTEPANAGQVIDAIGRAVPQLEPLLPACRLAIDNQYVSGDAPVSADCDIALIPPVSGG